ncbi:uncharacterized protein LOC125494702 [Beta vulgaris subsp. vulgaris]|uniref:uncharacterized protein LOC125494702 n=1 Tax=Beta vulgaris subsp. vulgaris TaxID=3555 RepID=UPI002037231C|nr:uncharacterized protein LOC125494702 [Beta vulgaris subsp. vulgaris]
MTNTSVNSSSQPTVPIFKGEKYHLWSIKMQTLFRSQELWDIVEGGYDEPEEPPEAPDKKLRENRKLDAKALFLIQSALDDDIFPRISAVSSSKKAWDILKKECRGDNKVISVKLQTLCGNFESLSMEKKESVQEYLSRVSSIVNQMTSFGEVISDSTVVRKVLRSLTNKFSHVVAAIEESKDMSSYGFDELMGSLLAHEDRISRSYEKEEEKDFQVQEKFFSEVKSDENGGDRSHGIGGFRGRGYARGRGGRGVDQRQSKSSIQCYYCKRYGRMGMLKLSVGINKEMSKVNKATLLKR